MAVLADRAADGVDASCLAFLVRRNVEDKKKEEEEKERKDKELQELFARGPVLFVHFPEEKEKEEKEEAPEVRVPTLSSWLWTSL